MNEKFEINKFDIKVLVKPFEYKEMAVNIEQVGYIFKYNIYDPKTKNWYSSFVTDEERCVNKICESCGQEKLMKKSYQPEEIVKIADYVRDMAKATIDLIVNKDQLSELEDDTEVQKGAVIVEALENNVKHSKKELEDAKKRD